MRFENRRAATLMLENGADVRVIQELLGHSKLSTTELYTRVSINLLKQVYSATHPAARALFDELEAEAVEEENRRNRGQQPLPPNRYISGEQVLYTYDALNRLATAAATSNAWAQSYSYDGFGNLLVQNQYGSAPYYSASPNPTTNQLGSVDANGNTTSYINSSNVPIALTYDVKNRLNTVGGYQGPQYSYAPGNKRVWRGLWTSGTLTTDEVTFWSVSGQKLATYQLSVNGGVINDSSSAPVLVATQTGTNYYFGRKLIKNSTWYGYVAADRLGSIGKYYPYGQEKPSATTNGTEKFTGYFRDAESGLDYADQRYHNPGTGRFLTPDPYMASVGPADPGSWNRYAYTRGDPVNRYDRLGLQDGDENLLGWVSPSQTIHVLLSKADKLNRGEAAAALRAAEATLARRATVQLFSSLKGTGVREAEDTLEAWLRAGV